MTEVQLFQAVVAALIGMAAATFGWFYSRRIGVHAAEQRMIEAKDARIADLEGRIDGLQEDLAASEKRCSERVAHLERLLEAAEKRWQRWAGKVG